MGDRLRRILWGGVVTAVAAMCIAAPHSDEAEVVFAQLIDNGGFEEAVPADALGAFWLTAAGRGRTGIPTAWIGSERSRSGRCALTLTSSRQQAWQYIPALEAFTDRMTISGSVQPMSAPDGPATAALTVRDARGAELVYLFGERTRVPDDERSRVYVSMDVTSGRWTDFLLEVGRDYLEAFGRRPLPRLTLILGKHDDGGSPVDWDDLAANVAFHATTEVALRDALLAEARWTFDNLFEHAIDDLGVSTPYLVKSLDAVTGEVLHIAPVGGAHPVYRQILHVLQVIDDPDYHERVVTMADQVIADLDPVTRLPRKWDGERDVAIAGTVIPAPTIDFLLEVYRLTGDPTYLDAAEEIGEAILAFAPRLGTTVRTIGQLPAGYMPNIFRSDTGDPVAPQSTYELHIRWFASAGALIHLYTATGRGVFRDAAIDAALGYIDHDTVLSYWGSDYTLTPFSFEPTWYDWDRIDPAFDDYFGYGIGGREGPYAILDIYERTGDPRLLPFLDASLRWMGDVWNEGMHRGGYTFADDARSWQAYYDRYTADPERYASHRELLIRNARNVLRSTQIDNGVWIDARFRRWDPSFPEDQGSCPRNLLAGLSWAYLVDDRDPVWLAMIGSVFETTVATYKARYGYVRSPEGMGRGPHPGGIELRFLGELLTHLLPHLDDG